MKKTNEAKPLAKTVTSLLNASLHVNANTTSCLVIHQPKEPKGLDRFKKFK